MVKAMINRYLVLKITIIYIILIIANGILTSFNYLHNKKIPTIIILVLYNIGKPE